MAHRLGIDSLVRRILNRWRFEVGQFLLGGTHNRLLLIAALLGLVALLGGLIEWWIEPHAMTKPEAVWWAFLRLTDPGYLGDDRGLGRRVVSTVVTVIGYVLFLGALIAIMTQWLNQTLRRLESGLSPLARDGHVLVAGWTDRTVSVLREMFRSEDRSHDLLGGRGARLTAVVLAEEASPELHQELRERMGEHFDPRQVLLRQGEALHLDHLLRADFTHAAAIVLPGDPFLGEEHASSDVRVMKSLMSIARHLQAMPDAEELPLVVAELFDARREEIARDLYPGRIEIVVSDRLIGRMLALNLRHRGLAHVYQELLFGASGCRLLVVDPPEHAPGRKFHELSHEMNGSVLLGILRNGEPELCPGQTELLRPDDKLVVFGRDPDLQAQNEALLDDRASFVPNEPNPIDSGLSSLLILGWTRKIPTLLEELTRSSSGTLSVQIATTVPIEERRAQLERLKERTDLTIIHRSADYTIPAVLEALTPAAHDAILLVGTDRLESGAESDARSLVGFSVLKRTLAGKRRPRIVVELMDPDNAGLLTDEEDSVEAVVSPQVLGRIMAQVALTPELCTIYDELFGAGGAELSICAATTYGVPDGRPVALREVAALVARAGHVLLGVHLPGEPSPWMNPPPSTRFDETDGLRVVVAIRTP